MPVRQHLEVQIRADRTEILHIIPAWTYKLHINSVSVIEMLQTSIRRTMLLGVFVTATLLLPDETVASPHDGKGRFHQGQRSTAVHQLSYEELLVLSQHLSKRNDCAL